MIFFKGKKLSAALLAILMCITSMNTTAFATGSTVTNPDGTTTTQQVTTSTVTDSGTGKVTVVEMVTDVTTGTIQNDSEFNTSVQLEKTEIKTTTTVKDAFGNLLSEKIMESENGLKKYSYSQAVTSNIPAVSVTLTPGKTTSATGTVNGSTTTTGDTPVDDKDTIYDYIKKVFSKGTRTVNGTTSAMTYQNTLTSGATMNMVFYSKLSGKTGVIVGEDTPDSTNSTTFSAFIKSGTKQSDYHSYYYPRAHYLTVEEYNKLPSDVKSYYTYQSYSSLTGKDTALAEVKDFFKKNFTDKGFTLPAGLYNLKDRTGVGWWCPVENGVWWQWIVAANPEKNNYANKVIIGSETNQDIRLALLYDKGGREAITYCLDEVKETGVGICYTIENLYEADYFGGTASQIEDAKARIRAVALNGYWGRSNDNFGSRQTVIANLKAAINDSNSGLVSKTYNGTTYTKAQLISLADGIDNSEALVATQAAFWRYGRSGSEFKGFVGRDATSKATMELIYTWLTSDYLKNKVGSSTTIIDEDSFFDPNSVKLIVKDKVSSHANNMDSNTSNDVYTVDLSFTMYYDLRSDDNLTVTLSDSTGNTIKSAKLGSSGIKRDGRTYTFEGLQLAENSNVSYKLTIKGSQKLVNDVYIFKAAGGYDTNQTLVGVGQGTNTVDATAAFSLKFDVTEPTQTVNVERHWANEKTTENEYVVVSGSKTWVDGDNQDGIRPESITIRLYADGVETAVKTVTASDNWSWTFTDLDKYKNGKEIVYTIAEDKVEGYSSVVNGFDVTNTHTPEIIEISGSKTWADNNNQDDIRPESITIRLYADGIEVASKTVKASDNWSWIFTGLDKYKNGKKIVYTIAEDKVNGYSSVVNGFNVTNTHAPDKVEVSGSKTWVDGNDQDDIRPESITIRLYADGVETAVKTVKASDNWSWAFTELDKFKNGKEIVYTISEDKVEGYTSVVTGYDVTNTHTPDQVEVSGSKTWVDENNQDGIRPESITIRLYADGVEVVSKVVTAADNWNWTFTGLDKYKDGKEIVYTIAEDKVDGYTSVVNGYDVTNTHTPDKVEVSGAKTWVDNNNQDGIRPESITIRLYADGVEVASKVVTAADNWSWTFTELDKYKNGTEIVYTISEDKVEGYTSVVNGYDVTNTHTPETVEVSGSKTWADNNNQDGIRPESITIRLYADGVEVASKVVTAADNWSWTFTELDKYKNGTEIVYTITEDVVNSYTSNVNGFDVTNTHISSTQVLLQGIKYLDGEVAGGFQFVLLKDGAVIETVTSREDGTFEFSELVFTEAREYRYQVKEVIGTDEGIEYDKTVYDILVKVTINGETYKADVENDDIEFNNSTKVEEMPDEDVHHTPGLPPTIETPEEVVPDTPDTGDKKHSQFYLMAAVSMVVGAFAIIFKSKEEESEK